MSGITVEQIGLRAAQQVRTPERVGSGRPDRASSEAFGRTLDDAVQRASAQDHSAIDRSALREKIHGMAEELVSGAFVRPVLAKLRETSEAAPPFAPGLWEKTFGPLMDERMASEIVESARFPLVETLTDQLMAKVHTPADREADHG